MAAPKGTRPPNAGIGRRKGVSNKTTTDVRKAIALIAEQNIESFGAWLSQIRDPARRCEVFLRLIEYHVPKLARSEMTGPDGVPIPMRAIVNVYCDRGPKPNHEPKGGS
jgi:hypothetical protein